MPPPPYCSGIVEPSRPSSPISRKMATSVVPLRNASSTRGSRRSCAYALAASRTARSSSLSCWSSSSGSSQWKLALALAIDVLLLVSCGGGRRRASAGDDGGDFDLDLGAIFDQRRHLDRRHGDVVVADDLAEGLADVAAGGEVLAFARHVPRHADDVLGLGTACAQDGGDVGEGEPDLLAEVVARPHAFRRPADLPGDVNGSAGRGDAV